MKYFRQCFLLLVVTILIAPALAQQETRQRGKKKTQQPTGPSIVWVNEPGDKQLPTGVTHRTFYSKAAGQDVGYCLYLPPGYDDAKNKDRRYPVIYNLHGNGGNEFHSFEDVEVLHEGIVAGKWPPMIVVLPNGGKSTFYKDSFDGKFPIETMFIKEMIPFIDRTCRTIAARHGRCVEGFSMGGRGSTRLAIKYPDLFCSLFCQAGNVPRTSENFDPSMPDVYPNNFLGPDIENYINNDVFKLLEKNKWKVKRGLRILIACGTRDGGHLPTVRDFHAALVEHNIDHTYIELEGLGHRRTEMIETLRPIWFDYHVESLRRAATEHDNR